MWVKGEPSPRWWFETVKNSTEPAREKNARPTVWGGAQPSERVSWRLRTANGRPRIVALENRVIWSGHVAEVSAGAERARGPAYVWEALPPSLQLPVLLHRLEPTLCPLRLDEGQAPCDHD